MDSGLARGLARGVALLGAGLFATAVSALSVNEPFSGPAPGSGWVLSGDATMTGTGAPDPIGSGWLRLTPATGGIGFAYNSAVISTRSPITAAFDFAAYGGSGSADGLTFFLFSASGGFAPGGGGGSLGYQGSSTGALAVGVIDAYPSGFTGVSDSVGICGPAPSTGPIADSGSLSPTPATAARGLTSADPNFRRLTITMLPDSPGAMRLTVQLQRGASVATVLSNVLVSGLPESVGFGLSAATGAETNIHEVRNFTLDAQHSAGTPIPSLSTWATLLLAGLLLLAAAAARRRR